MSFSYINPAAAILEMSMEALGVHSEHVRVPTIPCELDESWKEFEKELGKFKRELARVRRDANQKYAQLNEIQKSSQLARLLVDNLPSDDLKVRVASVIDSYESDEGLSALTQQYGKLRGQYDAMIKVLENTQADRYEKFTCFICQDRLVDLFIDPCGHVVCEPCWVRTRDHTKCPGCRVAVAGARKIFSM